MEGDTVWKIIKNLSDQMSLRCSVNHQDEKNSPKINEKSMRKLQKSLVFLFIFCATLVSQAQAQVVKGRVLDDGGIPVIGANIIEKGTSNGVATDVKGSFVLKVQSLKSTLVISSVGYQKVEVPINGNATLEVRLKEDAKVIDEVMVVGYAKQKKATLTGSVSAVDGDKLKQRSVASLSTALQGTMPGVTIRQTSGQPGADGASILIRGVGSINSSTSPLVLVDGVEMDMNQLDMSTVESVSVLKDAASASIYGSRASNGVILITTKRGKQGKLQVTYSGYATIQKPTNMPDPVSAWEYLQAELNAWDNAGISVTPLQRQQQLKLIEDQKSYKPDNWNRYDTDWKKETIKEQALMHNHTVNLTGGNENVQIFTTASFLDQDGLIENNSYKRTNFRLNGDAKITSWAKLAVESSYRESVSKSPGYSTPKSIINQALFMLPTLSAARELDGNWGYGKNGANPTAMASASGLKTGIGTDLIAGGTLTITPLKNWDVSGQYSYNRTIGRSRNILTPYKTSLKGAYMGQTPAEKNLYEGYSETLKNYYRLQSTYSLDFKEHKTSFILGFEQSDRTISDFGVSMGGFDLDNYYLSNGDKKTSSGSGSAADRALQSYFGRINYSYADKYLLELNGRYDGSSNFIKKNRWGFFPSVSAGWVISRENFMESTQSFLSLLKIRASYGILGNQDIGQYAYASTIVSEDNGETYPYVFNKDFATGLVQLYQANPDILWEKSSQLNLAVDATFWNGRLTFTGEYFIKKIDDMLMRLPLPYYTGMRPAWDNVGSMENKGWELTLGYKDRKGDFSYGITLNLSDVKNEITDLSGYISADKSLVEGYPVNGYWGYLTDGYFKDWEDVANSPKISGSARPGYVKYKKVNTAEGAKLLEIDNNDKVYLGDPYAHYEYGVTLNGGWKDFDLTVFVQGVGKRNIYMSGVGLKPFANGANLFSHQLDSWTPENPNAAYPILVPEANSADNFQLSDKWLQDASYMRLKNVVLGYTLPKSICSKIKLAGLRVYVSGQNLYTKSNFFKGYDPEVSYSGGVGGEFYPIMQTYTFGLDIKF